METALGFGFNDIAEEESLHEEIKPISRRGRPPK